MYTLVRRFIKTALVFFLLGLAMGGWILSLQVRGEAVPGPLIAAHTHLTLFGFVIMIIMGVAYWMFPRPAKDDFRYSPNLAEVNYWLITAGTVVRTIGELGHSAVPGRWVVGVIAAGSVAQIGAGLVFAWNIWSRIRSIGSHHREAKGERF